eukprot:COSAG05_NODE_2635_length_2817_cov_1.632082_6_plen_95_part_00
MFLFNLPVVVLAVATVLIVWVVGYALCVPLALLTLRFRFWPHNARLLSPYLTAGFWKPYVCCLFVSLSLSLSLSLSFDLSLSLSVSVTAATALL